MTTERRIQVRRDIFDYTMEPDGLGAEFRFYYMRTGDSWAFDIPGEIEGVRIAGGIDLLAQYRHKNVPPGKLFTRDLSGNGAEATKDNFGDGVILIYEV